VTESPRLYILFRTAVRGILPVIHLRFGVCAMAGWCGACHVTVDLGAPWALEALRIRIKILYDILYAVSASREGKD
jgi:hypothetical protein